MDSANEGILMTVRTLLREADQLLLTMDYDSARAKAQQAIDAALAQDHNPSIAAAYYGMASVIFGSGGDPYEAHNFCNLALQNTKANTTTDLLVRTLIARIKAARGNYEAAIVINEDLLRYYFENDHLGGLADTLRSLGDIYMLMGEYEKARERYAESLKLYRQDVDEPLNQAGVLVSYGSLMFQMNARPEARTFWLEARNIAETHGFRNIIEAIDSAMGLFHQ